MNKKKQKIFLIIILTIFSFTLQFFYFYDKNKIENINDPLIFSKSSGVYNDSITIQINKNIALPFGTKIYYTLNGDDPASYGNIYEGSITLELKNNINVYPVKAVAYYKGKYTKIKTNTYILCKANYYQNIVFASITSNYENLYDYNTGIMVPGKTYQDNLINGITKYIPGNYNNRGDEWIKNANIFILDNNKVISDNEVGLAISGGTSAAYTRKSFKIIFNYLLDQQLNYNFYDNKTSQFSRVDNYNSIKLRSNSQDESLVKSNLFSKLCSESNFDGCSTNKLALLFLNGENYGLYNIQQNFSTSFLKNKYAVDNIEKFKGSEYEVLTNLELFNLFNDVDENFKIINEKFDVDNMLTYYAIEILINNTDWPQNNFEIWRSTGNYDSNNKYTDGKYRFLIYDIDLMYNTISESQLFEGALNDIFQSLMNNNYKGKNSIFRKLMNNKIYRDKFITIIQDLLNTTFEEENIIKLLNESSKEILSNTYNKEDYKKINIETKKLEEKIKERDEILIQDFNDYFNLNEKHQVNIKANDGIMIYWNNQELYQNNEYLNNYYTDINLYYNYKIYPGYKFKYWLVNGEKIYTEELILDEKYKNQEIINIESVTEYIEDENHLLISEIYSNGSSDWIKITNTGKDVINLNGYYLSDNKKNTQKYKLPNINLKSNESIIINGEKNYYSIGDYICNFNIKEKEYIYLFKDNKIIDKIYVPNSSSSETYGRYDNSNVYKYFDNTNNCRKH